MSRRSTEEMADDVRRAGQSALALSQALQDADISLDKGLWFVTKGAQALERDYMREWAGELAGASLVGFRQGCGPRSSATLPANAGPGPRRTGQDGKSGQRADVSRPGNPGSFPGRKASGGPPGPQRDGKSANRLAGRVRLAPDARRRRRAGRPARRTRSQPTPGKPAKSG